MDGFSASIRINGIVIKNVNADPKLFSDENMAGLRKIADLSRTWGVKLGISLNFASPQHYGGPDTFNSLDECVIEWWTDLTNKVYEWILSFSGYLAKANSEGQAWPVDL